MWQRTACCCLCTVGVIGPSLNELLGLSMPSLNHRRNSTGRTCSLESVPGLPGLALHCGLQGISAETGPKFPFAMIALLRVIAARLLSLSLHFGFCAGGPALGNSVGFLGCSGGSLRVACEDISAAFTSFCCCDSSSSKYEMSTAPLG